MKTGPKPIPREKITALYVRRILRYETKSGRWFWRVSRGGRAQPGSPAGGRNSRYEHIQIFEHKYKSHRLAWLYITGNWPKHEIDHINGDSFDNRWRNLREADRSQNMANSRRPVHNTTGLKGVTYHSRDNVFESWIRVRRNNMYLGRFANAKLAHAAYVRAAKEYFGEFANAG